VEQELPMAEVLDAVAGNSSEWTEAARRAAAGDAVP